MSDTLPQAGQLEATAPPSQKGGTRPISFALEEDDAIQASVSLALRPEDFSRSDPSRMTVHHTLGGAWVDNFGPGLAAITLSGHTGWRGGSDGDGESRWRALRDTVFNGWHQRRKAAVAAGKDPSGIKLIYADALSDFAVEVAPLSITLRRSRSRPLLIQYSISMAAVDQNVLQLRYLQGAAATANAATEAAGFFEAVERAINTITAAVESARAWVNRTLVAPVRAFLARAARVMNAAVSLTRSVRALAGSVLSIPMMIAQAGMQLCRTIAAIITLPAAIMSDVIATGSAFFNCWCFLQRVTRSAASWTDFSDFFGASGCSSISGGRPVSPLSDINPWTALPQEERLSGVTVRLSRDAATAMARVAYSDPVLRPLPATALLETMRVLDTGFSVADDVPPPPAPSADSPMLLATEEGNQIVTEAEDPIEVEVA